MAIYKPKVELGSVWSMMGRGTHGSVAEYLGDNNMVKTALQPVLADPSNAQARAALIDLLARATGNCVGQAVVQELRGAKPADLVLNPVDNTLSIYHVLHPGTAKGIATAINTSDATPGIIASQDATTVVFQISRMAGRCIGQEIIAEALSLVSIVGKLEALLGGAAKVDAAIGALKKSGVVV
jgi:hypothetical protein